MPSGGVHQACAEGAVYPTVPSGPGSKAFGPGASRLHPWTGVRVPSALDPRPLTEPGILSTWVGQQHADPNNSAPRRTRSRRGTICQRVTIIRRVVSAARPPVNALFQPLSTALISNVDTVLLVVNRSRVPSFGRTASAKCIRGWVACPICAQRGSACVCRLCRYINVTLTPSSHSECSRTTFADNSAGSMSGSRAWLPTTLSRSLQDDDPDGDVVADRRGRGERMKELVIAEGLWPRVGPAKAIKDSADVVQHTFGDE